MERYSTVVLPWSGEQSICHGFEEKCHRWRGGLAKPGYTPHSAWLLALHLTHQNLRR